MFRVQGTVRLRIDIQDVPGIKVTTSGFNSRADSESKTSYTQGPKSQRLKICEFLKHSK